MRKLKTFETFETKETLLKGDHVWVSDRKSYGTIEEDIDGLNFKVRLEYDSNMKRLFNQTIIKTQKHMLTKQ